VLALGLLRYRLLPFWNPSLSRGATEALAQLTEGLVTTLIVTILIGAFIFFVTPAVMRVAKLEPVDPKQINPLLKEAALKSINWTFRGGMGRYTRAETLPVLVRRGRDSGTRRKIRIMLIDPDNARTCHSYASYRNGLASGSKGERLTADQVRDQILATIIAATRAGFAESMVDVELFVLPVWSVVRIDISDQYVIVTSEDRREPGLRADNGTHFYGTYAKDLDFLAKQGRSLPTLESLNDASMSSPDDLPNLLNHLGLNHNDLDQSRLARIWNLASEEGRYYE
jgi:hypothetical protein